MLIKIDSHDHYDTLLQKYQWGNAVISDGVGRNGTAGVVTAEGSTYFGEALSLYGWDIGPTIDNPHPTIIKGIGIRFIALPASGRVTLLQFMESDYTPHVAITLDNTGIIEAYRGTQIGTFLAAAADPVDIVTYYYLEVKVYVDDAAGRVVVKLWSDSTTVGTVIDFTGDTQNGGSTLTIQRIGHGVDGATPVDAISPSAWWDDNYICDDTGVAFNDFQGNCHVSKRLPNGTGTSEWNNYQPAVSGSLNYQNVSSVPPSSTAYNFAPFQQTFEAATQTIPFYSGSYPPDTVQYRLIDTTDGTLPAIGERAQIGDLLLLYAIYPWGITQATPDPTDDGFILLGEVSSSSGNLGLITRLYYKLADASDAAGKVYTWGFNITFVPLSSTVFGVSAGYHLYRITNVDQVTPITDYANTDGTATAPSVTFVGTRGAVLGFAAFEYQFASLPLATASFPAGYQDVRGLLENPVRFPTLGWHTETFFNPPDTYEYYGLTAECIKLVDGTQNSGSIAMSFDKTPVAINAHSVAIKRTYPNTDALPTPRLQANTTHKDIDLYASQDISSSSILAVAVNVCAEQELTKSTIVDRGGDTEHTVGPLIRLGGNSSADSFGRTPTTSPLIYQTPFDGAPDGAAWTPTKANSSTYGMRLDAVVASPPVPPPGGDVIFYADANQLAGQGYIDNDEIDPWVEQGIHTYTLDAAITPAGTQYIYQSGGIFPDGAQPSVEGFTESSTCTPATRNQGGFHNGATDADLFLPGAFTLITVVNFSKFVGCWQSGVPMIITRRGTDAGADFAGWQLYVTASSDTLGTVEFDTIDSSFGFLCSLLGTVNGIVAGTTYIITVICDGATVKLRVNGVQQASTAYVVDTNPAASDLWYLTNGVVGLNSIDPIQGQAPYTKIWNFELDGATLAAEEAALATRFQ